MRVKAKFAEKDFRKQVTTLAKALGWRVALASIPQGFTRGFPDLILVHPQLRRIVFVELKVNAKLTDEQAQWLCVLQQAGGECYVWTPQDWDMIVHVLRGERQENEVPLPSNKPDSGIQEV